MTKGKHAKGKKMTIPKGKPIEPRISQINSFENEVIKEFDIINDNLKLMNKVDRYLVDIAIRHKRTIKALAISQTVMALYLLAWLIGWAIGAW